MQTVKCKKCSREIILTTDEKKELIRWEEKGEICMPCKVRNAYEKRNKQKDGDKQEEVRESVSVDEEALLKEKFERLLELRKQYFDFLHGKKGEKGVIDEIEDFFDVDLIDVFDYYYDYFEFFNMGEGDGLTWNKLLDMIKHKRG